MARGGPWPSRWPGVGSACSLRACGRRGSRLGVARGVHASGTAGWSRWPGSDCWRAGASWKREHSQRARASGRAGPEDKGDGGGLVWGPRCGARVCRANRGGGVPHPRASEAPRAQAGSGVWSHVTATESRSCGAGVPHAYRSHQPMASAEAPAVYRDHRVSGRQGRQYKGLDKCGHIEGPRLSRDRLPLGADCANFFRCASGQALSASGNVFRLHCRLLVHPT
jgi:hypothetical protein